MILVSVARRYARALFEAAGDGYQQAGRELAAVADAIESSRESSALFANPAAPRELKNKIVDALIAQAGVSPIVGNGLKLINDRNRIPYLPAIVRAYAAFVDERDGRVRARVTSAQPLSSETEARLRAALSAATNKAVEMTSAVDPNLLGGVVAQVGNIRYDGSLKSQLERLKRELLDGA